MSNNLLRHTLASIPFSLTGIDDRAVLSIVVKAIKELASKVSETAHLVIATLTAHRVETNELCVGQTCVTEEQFNSVFSNQAASAAGATTGNGQPLEAPATSPGPEAESADTATSTTLTESEPITSASSSPPTTFEAANDHPSPSEELPATGTK